MALTAVDILVLIAVALAAALGIRRGFTAEVLSLLGWLLVIVALKLFHLPLTQLLRAPVGTDAGAAVLAFAILAGVTWLIGRQIAGAVGRRMRSSVLGPLDRALGFGFGALKGLVLASLAFLVVVMALDTVDGGPTYRPAWLTRSRTYPLLNATSAGIADFVNRRRLGRPLFGAAGDGVAPPANAAR